MADQRLGFVGLGVMGGPMAGHLLEAGFPVTVYNRTRSKAEALLAKGARFAELAEMPERCDAILLCVGRSEDVGECLDAMAVAKPGTLFIDHSTIEPQASVELHERLKARGQRFVDAPVTGGSMGAQKGQLTIFLGGEESDVERALPIVQSYAKKAVRVGGPGQGQMAKMVNQIAVAGALVGLCESMSFAKKAGLDVPQIMELVGSGAGGSWNFANYGPKILANDWSPGFSIKNQRKDFSYCRSTAERIDAAIPGTELTDELLAKLDEQGHGEWATVALYQAMLELHA